MLINIPSANTTAVEKTESEHTAIPTPISAPLQSTSNKDRTLISEEPQKHNQIFLGDSYNEIIDETIADSVDRPVKIAVILPFMLNDNSVDKQTQLYTEFFKGMLLAADSLKNNKTEVILDAYDSENNLNTVRDIISRPEFAGTDIIITPDNDEQLALISEYADTASATILNIFAVKNTVIYLIKNNAGQYPPLSDVSASSQIIHGRIDGYIPVILTSEEGKHDKDEFANLLKDQLSKAGKNYEIINYTGYLKSSDFSNLKNEEGRYVFVPVSGSSSEFNHIISALKNYRESSSDYNSVRLFGYPEWITFRGDELENLHIMNATVYSRFYNDESSQRSKLINDKYSSSFGAPMMSAVPVQGILGFDTGYFLLSAIDNDINLIDGNTFYNGIQSGFHFVKHDDVAGKVNDLLYFVNFRPSGIVDKRVLQ